MPELVLTNDQAKVVTHATGPVMLRDLEGKVIGQVSPTLTRDMVAEIKRRAADEPRYTGQQVQSRLHALQEEWDRTGGFDDTHMQAILKRLDESDPGHIRNKDISA